MKEFIINEKNTGQRLDKFLLHIMPGANTAFLYKMLRKKNITLNGGKAKGNESLISGDIIKIFFSDETFEKFAETKGRSKTFESFKNVDSSGLEVVYENRDFIIVNKPFGILSQKANNKENSINEIILAYLINKGFSKEDFNEYKPGVLNRLDRNTGGLIISAKTYAAAVLITDQIKSKKIRRIYNVIVHGNFDKGGTSSGYYTKNQNTNLVEISPYERENSVKVSTSFKLLKYENGVSLVECELLTGKSHQIRAMMKMLGFSVAGDRKYGDAGLDKAYKLKLPGQYLFAKRLIFPDGFSVECDLPPEFYKDFINRKQD